MCLDALALFVWLKFRSLLEATANKTMKTVKIKLQETQEFNVENPSNAKGENHGRQPARTSLYRVCVQRLTAAYKRNNRIDVLRWNL